MQKKMSIQEEFEALCGKYGLPEGEGNYYYLLDTFRRRRARKSFTTEEILSDFTALELARMLKQLVLCGGGFSLVVGGVKKDYNSPALVEVVKQSLEDALQARVRRGRNHLILSKGYGAGGDEGRAFLIPYPEGHKPQASGFSEEELEAIIRKEEELAEEVEKMKGNKMNYTTYTRNPELGRLVSFLYQYLPQEWSDATRNAFLADYLCGAGFLDFKGKAWVESFKEKVKEDRDRQVRRWVEAYLKTKEE